MNSFTKNINYYCCWRERRWSVQKKCQCDCCYYAADPLKKRRFIEHSCVCVKRLALCNSQKRRITCEHAHVSFFLCGTQEAGPFFVWKLFLSCFFLQNARRVRKRVKKKGMNTGAQTRIKQFTTVEPRYHTKIAFLRERERRQMREEDVMKVFKKKKIGASFVVSLSSKSKKSGIQLRWWHFTFTQNILATLTIISSLLKKILSHRQQYNDMRYNAPKNVSLWV